MPQLGTGYPLGWQWHRNCAPGFHSPPRLVQWHAEQSLRSLNALEDVPVSQYVDGFVLPVPKKNRARYVRIAKLAAKVWREHGALEYRECIADDVPKGKLTSFPRGVKLKSTETVWFSFIIYRNRKHRDRVNAKVMKDPRLAKYMNPKAMPLDGKRVIFGGFEVVVKR